jgi:hypothetical protein
LVATCQIWSTYLFGRKSSKFEEWVDSGPQDPSVPSKRLHCTECWLRDSLRLPVLSVRQLLRSKLAMSPPSGYDSVFCTSNAIPGSNDGRMWYFSLLHSRILALDGPTIKAWDMRRNYRLGRSYIIPLLMDARLAKIVHNFEQYIKHFVFLATLVADWRSLGSSRRNHPSRSTSR